MKSRYHPASPGFAFFPLFRSPHTTYVYLRLFMRISTCLSKLLLSQLSHILPAPIQPFSAHMVKHFNLYINQTWCSAQVSAKRRTSSPTPSCSPSSSSPGSTPSKPAPSSQRDISSLLTCRSFTKTRGCQIS